MAEQKVILTQDTPFLNSQCLFVEYDDVIASPFFTFLYIIKDNESFNELFDLSALNQLTVEETYEWYINRKEKNVIKCLPLRDNVMTDIFHDDEASYNDWTDKVLQTELDTISDLLAVDSSLNFASIMYNLLDNKLVHGVYVYSEFYSDAIIADLKKRFENKVQFVSGDLLTVLKENKIPADSTFVFSNIKHIQTLKEADVLNYASILIAEHYGYNYKSTNELVIDLKPLQENDIFKLDFFDNMTSID